MNRPHEPPIQPEPNNPHHQIVDHHDTEEEREEHEMSLSTQSTESQHTQSAWRSICTMGGIATLIQLVCATVTLVVAFGVGGEPSRAEEAFAVLQEDRLAGMLRLDFASLISMIFYYVTFFALYGALRRRYGPTAALATALTFVGITVWLSSHSALSIIRLSDLHAAAETAEQRSQLVAAAEAVLAANMWHSSGAFVAGILLQGAAVLISILMLGGDVFSKPTAYVGLVTHGLDLIHVIIAPFAPDVSVYLMAIAGTLYPIWFVMIGVRLLRLGRGKGS